MEGTRREPRRGAARAGPARPRSAVLAGCLLVAAVVVPLSVPAFLEQIPDAIAQAERALAHGRAADAAAIADRLDAGDPDAAVIRARLALRRGAYAEAERLLVPAVARDPDGDATLELGLLDLLRGRREPAVERLTTVIDAGSRGGAQDLARAARAARALGDFRQANAWYRRAAALADDPAIDTGWGELFLEKYNRTDAVRSFREALLADPEWAPARVGLARALAESNPAAADAEVAGALKIDPDLVEAHLFIAERELDEGRREEARAAIDRALAVNPSSLPARALVAAIAHLEGRTADFDAEVKRALAINPRYGEIYRVAGDHAARNYRFDEAVPLARRAITIDADNSRAHADLGMHLLRTGDEEGARQALERAFRVDPYDVITYNLLSLLDTLETFVTVESGLLRIRFHQDEAPILREYAVPLAEQALATLSKRYGFTPKGPILVEIFPRHDDFAVRNAGLPGMIGALGACFGRVVTMDSPRAQPPGTFNWQATLWHELAHVITLQMSNQRVPRWLTEGVSVYEEALARPEWGRDMEIAFARAFDKEEILKVRDLNAGFTRPETIALAYYEASLLIGHIVRAHGPPVLTTLLKTYAQGLDGEAALVKALGVTVDQLQAAFTKSLDERFAPLAAALREPPGFNPSADLAALRAAAAQHPGSYPVQLALGRALAASGDAAGAIAALERATAVVPSATGRDSARAALIEAALAAGDRARAMQELETLLAHDHTDVEAARQLLELAEAAGDQRRARAAERVATLDPFDAGPHRVLGVLALERKDADGATREFRAALAAGPVDRAGAHCDLAEGYLMAGRATDAKREALAALEIAPTFERAQELLLRTVEGRR
jgi:tetratricopeptide (TPR) repeat protein